MEVDINSKEETQETPLVSIIIPTYNRAHLIEETLDSILAQTYPNWECIIVDDGSTDDTDAVVGKYVDKDARFRYHHRPADRPKGANACRNYGFEISNGEYVNWFDSDDLMHPYHLLKKVDTMALNNLDFVVCEVARFYKSNINKLFPVDNLYNGLDVQNQFIGKLTLFTPGPMWSRLFLINNDLKFESKVNNTVLNDWVFGLTALVNSNNYNFIREILVYYRSHEVSVYSERKSLNTNLFMDEFYVRKSMFNFLKKNKKVDKSVEEFYSKRLLYLTKVLLEKREVSKSFTIISEVISLKICKLDIISIFKIFLTYFFVIIFKKGYNILKSI